MSGAVDLIHLIDRFPTSRILCIGDIMLDRFLYGSVKRISPEAPVPVLRVKNEITMLGGAGNVLRNFVELGAEGCFISAVGDDRAGREVLQLIADIHEVEPNILIEKKRPTTIKRRFVAGGQQLLRVDHEEAHSFSDKTSKELIKRFDRGIDDVNVIILSDYQKGIFSDNLLRDMISLARKKNKLVIIDPKRPNYDLYKGASVLTPNWQELSQAVGHNLKNEEEMIAAAREIISENQVDSILVTRSQYGMSLVTADDYQHFPAEAKEVFDVSGAGDTVVATLATALAAGASMKESVELANISAGIVVGKVGTATVERSEIRDVIKNRSRGEGSEKALTLRRLEESLDKWRQKDQKIGFTNGCFDLLHPGHISLLKQAKSHCDKLVIGLNSDASVKRLKGETRPVQSEISRGDVLSSLSYVDAVVVFTEDTPQKLIEFIKPDILVKGADYKVEDVVGADFVQSYGGEVVLAEFVDGHSTSSMIERIES